MKPVIIDTPELEDLPWFIEAEGRGGMGKKLHLGRTLAGEEHSQE
jgi:hypothetical protein